MAGAEYCCRLLLIKDRKCSLCLSDPVVSSLVFVVEPVELFIRAVLKAVLSDPLVGITAALSQDPRHDLHVPQVNLQPLGVVLKLGEPGTPAQRTRKPVLVQQVYSTCKVALSCLVPLTTIKMCVSNHDKPLFQKCMSSNAIPPRFPTRSPGC